MACPRMSDGLMPGTFFDWQIRFTRFTCEYKSKRDIFQAITIAMFPFHEDTLFLLSAVIFTAGISLLTAIRGRLRTRYLVPLFLLGLLWPWPIAIHLGLDGYTMNIAFHLGLLTAAALMAGTIWGVISRHISTGIGTALVAVIPAIVISGIFLERQRVPDTACSQRALVRIGDLNLAIPREIGFRSTTADGAPEQAWEGSYGSWVGNKPKVKTLCDATDGGRKAIDISHIWLPYNSWRKMQPVTCKAVPVPAHAEAYCAALARTEPTIIQFYVRPDGLPRPSLSYFNEEVISQAVSEGQLEGYRCGDPLPATGIRYCTIWMKLTPEILAVSAAKLVRMTTPEDAITDTAFLLNLMIRDLSTDQSDDRP